MKWLIFGSPENAAHNLRRKEKRPEGLCVGWLAQAVRSSYQRRQPAARIMSEAAVRSAMRARCRALTAVNKANIILTPV